MLTQPGKRRAFASLLGSAVLASVLAAPDDGRRFATPAASPAIGPGTLLVARRGLPDPNFTETVVLVLSYGPGGALGVVVNRPSDVELSSLAPKIEALQGRSDPLYIGGPVPGEELFVLVRTDGERDDADRVFDGVYASGDPQVLERLARERVPPERMRVYAGYSGWSPGQLDNEIERGDWHLLEADEESIFTAKPRETWNRLIPPSATEQVLSSPAPPGLG